MQELETIRRISESFWADGRRFERMPAFRADGTEIGNEFEWQVHQTTRVALQVAAEMIARGNNENRSFGAVGGSDVHLKFNFSVQREGQGFSKRHNGHQMIIVCDVTRYGKAKG